jgi:hypothetical protein
MRQGKNGIFEWVENAKLQPVKRGMVDHRFDPLIDLIAWPLGFAASFLAVTQGLPLLGL